MSTLSFFNESPSAWPAPPSSDGGLLKLKRPGTSRNVSFTSGTRPAPSHNISYASEPRPATSRGLSYTTDVRPSASRNASYRSEARTITSHDDSGPPEDETPTIHDVFAPIPREKDRTWQHINRRALNVDPTIEPNLPIISQARQTPFAAYHEAFSALLGRHPTLDVLITDKRAPFFYAGGAWISERSTLFVTSNLIRDPDPAAVSSASRRTEITKLELYGDHSARDKVRCPERSYMAAGCAQYPGSSSPAVVVCAQGSMKEPAGLVCIDVKRPHRARMLLNNFHGRPLNSPCDVVTNFADKSLYFSDPAYGYERGFRPRPQLPPGHIYRFDPESGDCRVVGSGLSRPASLAFSPDFSVLYVSELGDKYGGTYIYAYDVMYAHTLKSAPAFNISVVPGSAMTNGGHSSNPSTSSTDSSNGSRRTAPAKNTPTSSPQGANGVSRNTLSRSNSHSGPRTRDMGHHHLLSSLSLGRSSPTPNGPTSNPAPQRLNTPFSSSSSPYISRSTFLGNKRLFAYSPNTSPNSGISTDPVQGNVWLGTEEGVEVWGATNGELLGKIVVEEEESQSQQVTATDSKERKPTMMKGVSKVAFAGDGQALLLGGERVWRLRMGGHDDHVV